MTARYVSSWRRTRWRGGQVLVVELSAGLATRLARNRGEDRIAAKPTKRDVEWSDGNVRELEQYRLNSDPTGAHPTPADAFLREHPHLRLDTTDLVGAGVGRAGARVARSAVSAGRPHPPGRLSP